MTPRPIATEMDAEADRLIALAHANTPAPPAQLVLAATRIALMAITVRRMQRDLDEVVASAAEDEQAAAARQRRAATIAAMLPPGASCHLSGRRA